MKIMTLLFLVSFAYAFTANGEDIVSEYEGPRLKRGKNWEEGIEMCNAAHMTEFFTATKRIIPLDVLQKAIAEAMRKEYCLGFYGSGDKDGNHKFNCFGVVWNGGKRINLRNECKKQWEISKENYKDWLYKKVPDKIDETNDLEDFI